MSAQREPKYQIRHRRHRVDWDEEIRKTNRIARRSILITALSFGLTLAVMLGVNRAGFEIDVPQRIISIACIILACFVLRATLKHRAKIKQEREERQYEADFLNSKKDTDE